jgi:hypothetical protein
VSNVLKSGSFKLLEPSGPVHANKGTGLPLTLLRKYIKIFIQMLLVDKKNMHRGTEDDTVMMEELTSSRQ